MSSTLAQSQLAPPTETGLDTPRVAARIGPIELHERLNKPVVTVDESQRTITTDPTNEPPIIQSLGRAATKVQIDGTCLLRRANKLHRLLLGGPFEIRTDRYQGWALAKGVSTNPYEWRPSAGNWGYEFKLDLVGTTVPADGERTPLPGNAAAASSSGRPEPRERPTTKIGGVELPPRLAQPAVAIDGTAAVNEHDLIGAPTVVRYGGRKASKITIDGSAFLRHARQLSGLARNDQITVRSDRFHGDAIVKSVRTEPTAGFYETNPNRPGWKYTIEMTEVLGGG